MSRGLVMCRLQLRLLIPAARQASDEADGRGQCAGGGSGWTSRAPWRTPIDATPALSRAA